MNDGVRDRDQQAALDEREKQASYDRRPLAIAAHTPRSEDSRESFSGLVTRV